MASRKRQAGVNSAPTCRGVHSIKVSGAKLAVPIVDDDPDIRLRDADSLKRFGHSLIGELATDDSARSFPVLVVSAYARKWDRTPQFASVLWKPFDSDDLIGPVEQAVSGHGNWA